MSENGGRWKGQVTKALGGNIPPSHKILGWPLGHKQELEALYIKLWPRWDEGVNSGSQNNISLLVENR